MRSSDLKPPSLAYLTTAYPEVSHTFIRREICELERLGYQVLRFSIRRHQSELVDPLDQIEAEQTVYILAQGAVRLLVSALLLLITRPLTMGRAVTVMLTMHQRSERGLIRHIAYLVEACDLVQQLQQQGLSHVHVHFGTNAAAVARLASYLTDITYSMTIHGPSVFDAVIGFSLANKVIDSTFTVAISDYCAAQLKRWVPYDHWSKIHIIRCTIDANFQTPVPISPDSNTLVCIGRLAPPKGHLVLLQALYQLVQDGVSVHLIIAGGGDMQSIIAEQIETLQLQSYVSLPGWVSGDQVRQLLSESRALVLPSFAEGLPVVIMEAFAMKRPVITTFVAGIPELVHDQINGWLVPAGQVNPLAQAIREALTTPIDTLNQMAEVGYQQIMAEFQSSVAIPKLADLFQRYCGISAPTVSSDQGATQPVETTL